MFIPLEGEKAVCLENVVAIYKKDGGSVVLKRDGTKEHSDLSPETVSRRRVLFAKKANRLK